MFKYIKSKLQDMGTIKRLGELAEAHAQRDRQRRPGAEHFLLAALDLPDGTAHRAFLDAGADPDGLRLAIENQYADALRSIGLEPPGDDAEPEPQVQPQIGPYRAAPSGEHVMQELAANGREHGPLLGAHVVAVVATMEHGVAARALSAMNVDRALLKRSAESTTKRVRT